LMRDALRLARRALRFLVLSFRDFIFPPVCLGCDTNEVEDGLVCRQCVAALRLNPPPARNFAGSHITHTRSLGYYVPPFSTLVHQLKYYNRKALAGVLGQPMAGLVLSDGLLQAADVVVPIPLHPSRLRERGYNQARLLAEQVSITTRMPWLEALKRVKNTKDQVNLDDRARKANLEGAFELMPGADVRGKRVLLIDDVATTGATLGSAAQVLRQAGAADVLALVVTARA
jgi:ComF family protein